MVACANWEKTSDNKFSLDLIKFLIEELNADCQYKSEFGNALIYSI